MKTPIPGVASWITLCIISLCSGSVGQTVRPDARNFTVLDSLDSPEARIAKAARVAPSQRQLTWQRREFVAFVHFTVNTFTDREWGEGMEDPAVFNPTHLDARQWVRVFRDAGMKLVIITAKHHDGFCLWPSKYTEHSVKNSPWKKGKGDVLRELSRACREAGLAFGVYLSPWDRHERTYGDSPKYNEHFRNQLRELLTNYGEIAEVWFDGACGEGPNGKRQVYDWRSYYEVIRKLQPNAVIFGMGPDVRWVGTESGYGRETEWSVVPVTVQEERVAELRRASTFDSFFTAGDLTAEDLGSRKKVLGSRALLWYPAETDVSIRPGWFYHAKEDTSVKSPEKLVDIYYSSVGRNSVLLLNVPPDRRGLIHENDARSLAGMRRILDATFSKNLARGARVLTSNALKGHEGRFLLDGRYGTYWKPGASEDSPWVVFEFPRELALDRASLAEYIPEGQHVEAFRLESWDGAAWKEFARGTTIGYRRLLRFNLVTTHKVRLTIEGCRSAPALNSFGLYRTPSGL